MYVCFGHGLCSALYTAQSQDHSRDESLFTSFRFLPSHRRKRRRASVHGCQ